MKKIQIQYICKKKKINGCIHIHTYSSESILTLMDGINKQTKIQIQYTSQKKKKIMF